MYQAPPPFRHRVGVVIGIQSTWLARAEYRDGTAGLPGEVSSWNKRIDGTLTPNVRARATPTQSEYRCDPSCETPAIRRIGTDPPLTLSVKVWGYQPFANIFLQTGSLASTRREGTPDGIKRRLAEARVPMTDYVTAFKDCKTARVPASCMEVKVCASSALTLR